MSILKHNFTFSHFLLIINSNIVYKGEIFNYLDDIIYLMDNNLHIKAIYETKKSTLQRQTTFDHYVKLHKEKFGKDFEIPPYIKRIKE